MYERLSVFHTAHMGQSKWGKALDGGRRLGWQDIQLLTSFHLRIVEVQNKAQKMFKVDEVMNVNLAGLES